MMGRDLTTHNPSIYVLLLWYMATVGLSCTVPIHIPSLCDIFM